MNKIGSFSLFCFGKLFFAFLKNFFPVKPLDVETLRQQQKSGRLADKLQLAHSHKNLSGLYQRWHLMTCHKLWTFCAQLYTYSCVGARTRAEGNLDSTKGTSGSVEFLCVGGAQSQHDLPIALFCVSFLNDVTVEPLMSLFPSLGFLSFWCYKIKNQNRSFEVARDLWLIGVKHSPQSPQKWPDWRPCSCPVKRQRLILCFESSTWPRGSGSRWSGRSLASELRTLVVVDALQPWTVLRPPRTRLVAHHHVCQTNLVCTIQQQLVLQTSTQVYV